MVCIKNLYSGTPFNGHPDIMDISASEADADRNLILLSCFNNVWL